MSQIPNDVATIASNKDTFMAAYYCEARRIARAQDGLTLEDAITVLIFGWWWVGIMGQDNAGRRQLTLLLSNKDKLDDDFVRDLMRGEGREWMEAVLVAIAAG
jgi:hypothetical protein